MDRIATSVYYIECVYVVVSVHNLAKGSWVIVIFFCDMESF